MINLIFSTMLLASSVDNDGIKVLDREIDNTHGGWISGSRHLDEIDLAYEVGVYNQFLESIDQQYVAEKDENGRLEDFIRQLEEKDELAFSEEEKESAQDVLRDDVMGLISDRNLKLLGLAAQFPHHEISQVIESVEDSSQIIGDYEESIGYVFGMEYLCWKGTHPIEVKAAKIYQEFMLKELMVDAALLEGKIDGRTALVQKIVLQKEKYKRVAALCEKEGGEECPIAKKLKTACKIFPMWAAHNLDLAHIRALGRGDVKAKNDVERQVQAIFADTHSKIEAVMKGKNK